MKCIYCLEFTDGKRYIGSTKDLKQRLENHRAPSGNKKYNPDLKEAILQGGYEVVILEQCPDDYDRKQIESREQHYVDLWWDYGILYNKHKNVRGSSKGRPGIPCYWKGKQSVNRGKKYSQSYQRADEIRADRAAGMAYHLIRAKYKVGNPVLKDILSVNP